MNLRAKAILAIGLIAIFCQTLLATITYTPSQPKVNEKIAFTVSNPDGVSENRAQWNFGDGTAVSWGPSTIAHIYKSPGAYTVKASYRTRKAVFTTDQVSLTIRAESAERVVSLVPFQISSVEIRFEDGKTRKIVPQNFRFLVASADIKYKGSGTLKVEWLVDGKSFKTLSYSLPSSGTFTVDSGRIPGLPTQTAGSHRVSLKILQPKVDIFIPVIVYEVMRIDLGKLIRPRERLTLAGKVIDSLSGKPVAGATVEYREVDSATGITQPQALSASTDSQGKFAFKRVKPNSDFELRASEKSHKMSTFKGSIADKDIIDLIIEIEPLERKTVINRILPERHCPGEKTIFEGQDLLWAGETAESGEIWFSSEREFNPSTSIKVEKIDLWQKDRIEFILPANLQEATQYYIHLFQKGQEIEFSGGIALYVCKREVELSVEDFKVLEWYQKTTSGIDFLAEVRIKNSGDRAFHDQLEIALWYENAIREKKAEVLKIAPGEEKVVSLRFSPQGGFELGRTYEMSIFIYLPSKWEYEEDNEENNSSPKISFQVEKSREAKVTSIVPERPCPGEKVTLIGQDFLWTGEVPETGEVWLSSSREFDPSQSIKVEKIDVWQNDRIEFLLPGNVQEGIEQNFYLFQKGKKINPYWTPFYVCLRQADLSVEDFRIIQWYQKTDREIDLEAEIRIKNIGDKTFDRIMAIALWHNILGEGGSHWEGLEESLELKPGEERIVTKRFTYQGGFELGKTHEISICLYGNKEATEWVDENSDNNCSKSIAFTVERSRKTEINAIVPERPCPGEKTIFEGQDVLWIGETLEGGEIWFSFEEVFNPSTAIKVDKIDLWQNERIEFILPANLREATQYYIHLFQAGQKIKFSGRTTLYVCKREVELSVEDFKVLEWYQKTTSGIDFLAEVRIKNSGDRAFHDQLEISLWYENAIKEKKAEVLAIAPGEEKVVSLRFSPQGGFELGRTYEMSIVIYLPSKWEYQEDSRDNNSSPKISFTIEGKPVIIQFSADPPRAKPGEYSSLKWEISGGLGSAEIWMEGGQVIHKVTSKTGSFQVQISQAVLPRYFLTVRSNVGMDQKDLVIEVYTDKPVIKQFFSDPTKIKIGEVAKLNWEIAGNFDKANIFSNPNDSSVGKISSASGSMEVKPFQTTEYKLNVTKEEGVDRGWDEKIIKIEVYGDKPVIEYFGASLSEISYGQYFKLVGKVKSSSEASISPDIGKVWLNEAGEFETTEIRAEKNIQYVLVASGPGGVSSASVELKVRPTIDSFGPDKSLIECGDTVRLYWDFHGASEGVIEPGPLRAYPSEGILTVSPQETTTYTLKIGSAGGTSEMYCTVSVRPKIDRFDALPPIINIGDISELRYVVLGAKEVTIEPDVGKVNPGSGSIQIRPLQQTAYTLTARGTGDTTSTQYAKVKVTIFSPIIRHFSADQTTIIRGQSTSLRWEVDYTVSARIEPEVGEIDIPPKAGSILVSPVATTTYIITATNPTGSSTQKVTITVRED